MRNKVILLSLAAAAVSSQLFAGSQNGVTHVVHVTDTVYLRAQPIDYDELARRVAVRIAQNKAPTVIAGDLIVKGRLGVGGAPEPNTRYGVTIRGSSDAAIRFISNEGLADPQRVGSQHRHVGTVGVGQDGGLRFDQNSTCFSGASECVVDDRRRRRAYSGFDSMGDMSFYLSDVDSLTGRETAPRSQSLVFRLLDWDGHVHIGAQRPGQRVFFNSSTNINASDLQWEVPFPSP